MATNIYHFQGKWHVWWVQGVEPVLQQSWMLLLGTGHDGAAEPFLSSEGQASIGFAILEPSADRGWTTYASSVEKGPLTLYDGQLRWDSEDKNGDPVRIYISVAEAVDRDGKPIYRSIYGTTLHGDPDQVAVWGANDSPPP